MSFTSRIASISLTLLLLTSAGLGPVGTATAASTSGSDWCSDKEKLAIGLSLGAGAALNDCKLKVFHQEVNESADQTEMWTELYSMGVAQYQKSKVLNDSMQNYLKDTKTIALIEGKNEVVRQASNSSGESIARVEAKAAITDYYAAKQMQLITSWEAEISTLSYMVNLTTDSGTPVNPGDVHPVYAWDFGSYKQEDWSGARLRNVGGVTRSVTLVNGTTVTYNTTEAAHNAGAGIDSGDWTRLYIDRWAGLGTSETFQERDNTYAHVAEVKVKSPPSIEGASARFLRHRYYISKWQEIQNQSDTAQANIDTFVDNTYPKIESGALNATDLVDPYLGAREYEPGTSESWARRSLTSLGIEPPTNASEYSGMMVRDETTNVTYSGLLMSDGRPPAGGYAVGTTYNASNISGQQFVSTSSGPVPLRGNFTLVSATDRSGDHLGTGEMVTYNEDVSYTSTNLTEFVEAMERAESLRLQVEQYEQASSDDSGNSSSSSSFLPDTGGPLPKLVAGALVFGIAIVLLVNRDGDTTVVERMR